ncbi:MAG: tetratricopeptide repeat protein [Planctomycetota bacterium]
MTADLFAPRRRLITPLRVLISFVGLGLVTVLVLAVSVTQCTPPDPARHGRGFYNQEKWQSAIKQFSRALDRHPDDVSSLYYRGLAYLYDGDTGRAIDDLEKVRRLAPDTERIDERLGRAYLAHGNHTRAREIFESIAVREPDNSRVLHLLAQTHYDLYQAHLVEIGALVTRYIGGELAAELLRDLELLVFSRHMEDELHALLLEHERVFDASGERELQRLMDRAKQEIDRSVPHFRAALAVPEFDPDAALSLARIYFRQFRLGWTRDECEDAIRRCSDPLETLDFRLLLASVYFNMGVFDRCADVYRKTLDLIDDLARQDVIPDSEWAEVQSQKDEVIDRLLPVLLILEDYRSVSELAQKRGDPTDLPILFYYLGTSAYHRGEIEGARQYLQKAKIAFENKPELRIRYRDAFLDTYLNLAQLAIEESQFGRAENYLASLLQRDPSSAEGHLALADLRLRQGNERGALQALEKAMFEIPESAELFERWWQLSTESWAAMGLPADAPRGEVWNYYRRNQLANYLRLRTAQAILLELFPRRVEQDTQLALDIVTQLSIRYPDFIPVKRIQARAFLARNDFKLARELFEQILEVHPEDERAIGGLRACAAGLKDIDGLEKWTHEALKVGAAGEGPLAILDRLIETGRYNRALAYAEQLLSLPAYRGLDVEVRRLRALLLEGNTEEVLLQLQSLLEKGTQHPALTPLLVNALVRSGRTARAFEAIRKAEKDGPENTQAFTAELYRELLSVLADQEISRASTLIVKAAQAAYPADEEIAALASRFYRRVQSYSQAIQVLSRAASGSLTTSNLLDLALLSIPTGRRLPTGSTAWRELEKQLESNTATKPVLAILLQMSGDSDQALKNLPDPKDARSLRAARLGWPTATLAVRAQRGDFAEASEVLTTFPPDYGIGYKQILDYCAADGLYKQEVSDALLELALFGQVPQWEREAIGSVEFLLSVFPTNSALRRLHPRLLSLTGASTEEVLALEERLSREDPRPENFRALAAARLRQGDTAGAIRALLDLREHGKPTPVDLRLMAQALAEAGEPMAAVRVFDILFRFDQLKVDKLNQLAAASDRPKTTQQQSTIH